MRRLALTKEAARVMLATLRRPPPGVGHTHEALESLRAIKGALAEAMPEYLAAWAEKADEIGDRRTKAIRTIRDKDERDYELTLVALDDQDWADEQATGPGAETVELVLGNEDFQWAKDHCTTIGGWSGDEEAVEVEAEIVRAFDEAKRVRVVGDRVEEIDDEPREATPVALNRRQRRARRAKGGRAR